MARRWRAGSMTRSSLQRGAVLYLNDQYGRGVRQTFVSDFTRRGGVLLSIDPYLGDTPSRRPLPRPPGQDRRGRLPRRGGKSWRSGGDPPPGAASAGSPCPYWAATASKGSRQAGAIGRRVCISRRLTSRPSTHRANRAFLQAYRKKFPAAGLPNQPAAATYDAVYLLRDVITRAGPEREAVRRELARVGTGAPAFQGSHRAASRSMPGATFPIRPSTSGWCEDGAVRLAGSP